MPALVAALRRAALAPTAEPVAYFDTFGTPPRTFIVHATDLFRRCTVDDAPLTTDSLVARGCTRTTATAITRALGTEPLSFNAWLVRLARVPRESLNDLFAGGRGRCEATEQVGIEEGGDVWCALCALCAWSGWSGGRCAW
jgi:hypothetical protein